ncbi:hypothetical protein [Dyadobacter diqingensis]|uniref:hypothetical protein n=1 Tax=Dyadobacter diqingensis TaxID=2938121 RepID=UPI0020C42BB8|nr:hypothetical protein [Dyadobacter diqingensis]
MLRRSTILLLILCFQLVHCRQARSYVRAQELPNYDKGVANHILFLDFQITQDKEKGAVKAELINAIAGNGKMKDHGQGSIYPDQIKVVHYFSDRRTPVEMFYEHPLLRTAEVFSQDGNLSKSTQTALKGTLSIRFQEDQAREKIELYSVTPDRGAVKIYSLLVKK